MTELNIEKHAYFEKSAYVIYWHFICDIRFDLSICPNYETCTWSF